MDLTQSMSPFKIHLFHSVLVDIIDLQLRVLLMFQLFSLQCLHVGIKSSTQFVIGQITALSKMAKL